MKTILDSFGMLLRVIAVLISFIAGLLGKLRTPEK
jgi:hypothetical protein